MSSVRNRLTKFLDRFDESPAGYSTQLRLDLAEIIWRSLARNKWSQRRLSKKSGLADSIISNLIHGNKNCTLDTVSKVLHALGTRATLQETFVSAATDDAVWRFYATSGDGIEIQTKEYTSGQTPEINLKAVTRTEGDVFQDGPRRAVP